MSLLQVETCCVTGHPMITFCRASYVCLLGATIQLILGGHWDLGCQRECPSKYVPDGSPQHGSSLQAKRWRMLPNAKLTAPLKIKQTSRSDTVFSTPLLQYKLFESQGMVNYRGILRGRHYTARGRSLLRNGHHIGRPYDRHTL